MTSDEVLREALIRTAKEHFSQYDLNENEKPHRFSLAFYVRKLSVERLAAKAEKTAICDLPRHRYMPIRKLSVIIALILAAVLLTAAAWVVYVSVGGFVFETHSTYSDVSVDFSMYTIKDTIEDVYRLPVESDCELVYEFPDSEIITSEYVYEDKVLVFVQCARAFVENIMMNTDGAEVSEVSINDNKGFVLLHYNNTEISTSIIWIQDEYVFYIFSGSLEKEELIMLAESVVLK